VIPLAWGSVPPGLDKDDPIVVAMTPPTAGKHGGTYEILNW
jgi:hypothetical protein